MFDFVLQRSFLEAFVVIGVAITVIGIYWRIILIGGAALALIVIVANHTSEAEVKPNIQVAQVQPNQEVIKEVVVNPTPVKYVDPRRDEYVRDCISYGFAKQWCKDNWDDKLEKDE